MTGTQIQNGLLSPASSEHTHIPSDQLPVPRSRPLLPASHKETSLINFIDNRILAITRRYAKSFAADESDQSLQSGYTSFDQIIVDIDAVLDVVWISATPSIQIPYLLALAGHFRGYMHSFPFVTTSFPLARKFDLAFSRLLSATADNPAVAHVISATEKVRIRSLAQETRYEMIEVAGKSGLNVRQEDMETDEDETDMETDVTDTEDGASNQSIALSLGRVYERTLEILGGDLSSLPPPDTPRDQAPAQSTDDVEIIDL
ncbi:hypothetical protein PMZ80_009399 [Knufia obscura]|uniref:Meiotic recombination protein DMC1 n=2 Tax=Knufia TaxID=430999 RepID=A0AAN8F3I9_9EURO|nr:hypothetical protein PMZ80_009399 [Knufia obscura]KAK5955858.1 hypothetical protein OHC33_003499 [Knufia fluminis]